MKKTAATTYPIHDLLAQRWSPLAFSSMPVEKEKLDSLLEAARWAPSSYNEQPWSFIVGLKEGSKGSVEAYSKIISCLADGNVVWAKQAPVLMLSVTSLHFSHNGNPNRHAFHDIGLAAGNLVVQAAALGLMVHQMAGIDPEKARKEFQIPKGYEAVTAIAIGYEGDTNTLPAELKERQLSPRTRKPLQNFVFSDGWGRVSELVSDKP